MAGPKGSATLGMSRVRASMKWYRFMLACQAVTLASATLAHHDVHHNEAILMRRFQPRSVDSSNIISESASAEHHHKRRMLSDAIADNEFVSASGTFFQINGKKTFFAGTNIFYLLLQQTPTNQLGFSDDGVSKYLSQQATYGINLIRFWGAINGNGLIGGYGFTDTTDKSIMISIDPSTLQGTYNETGFRRFDLVLDAASRVGIYSIVTLVNGAASGNTTHPAIAGGMQWYVDQVLGNNTYGSGGSYNLFYTDAEVKQAYKNYISTVLNRVNSYNGRLYKEDPAVFSWELANEAGSTADETGQTIAAWAAEMAAHIRSIDQNHMISTGEVGYDVVAGVNSSQCMPCASPDPVGDITTRVSVPTPFSIYHTFIDAGDAGKGSSYSLNTAIPDISFGTVHVYPESLGVPFSGLGGTDNYTWTNEYLIKSRAAIAAQLNKPFMVEEFGQTPDYGNTSGVASPRDVVYDSQVKAAIAAGAGAIMAWEELPMIIEPTQYYDYTWNSDGGEVIGALVHYASCLNRGTCHGYSTPESVSRPVPAGFLCDLGQQPRRGCDYCDQVYQYPGGPLNTCAQDGANGTDSATCQQSFNLRTCAASCMCGLPRPPFLALNAPGCGFNSSLFSQQSHPGPGCSCCDAGFEYEESCATQLSYNTSTDFKCNEAYVKPYCMCTCSFCPATPDSDLSTGAKAGLGVGVGVGVGLTIVVLSTSIYCARKHAGKQNQKQVPDPLPNPKDPNFGPYF